MNGYRGILVAIFPIIIILFAGGWSDKKGIRKPCILFPLIGEVFAVLSLLISAIFMDDIPMEFSSVLSRLIPAMTGGGTLFIMGIFSYLSAITTEEERTFRLGILSIISTITPIISLPFSAFIYHKLGYVYLFILGTLIYIFACIYCIFGIKEIPKITEEIIDVIPDVIEEQNGIDNKGFENIDIRAEEEKNKDKDIESNEINQKKKNLLVEFFDPTLAIACIYVLFKERPHNIREILFMLIICYFLIICPGGEGDFLYLFGRIKLGWEADGYTFFNTYTAILGSIGSLLTVGLFSRILGMSDPMIGIMSTIFTIISKPIFAFASNIITLYVATTVDLFFGLRLLVIKTMTSRLVEENEIGRIYSILGIFDAIPLLFIPEVYGIIYSKTVETLTGAIYLFSLIFLLPVLIIFGILYVQWKKILEMEKTTNDNENDENSTHQSTRI